jgi:Fe-Mn family superoxide dismutase
MRSLKEFLEMENDVVKYELPQLPYDYNSLEPYIDEATMIEHHTKHHQGYVNKLNAELEDSPYMGTPIDEILKNIDSFSQGVRNNGGGHYNHSLFWKLLSPNKTEPTGKLRMSLIEKFETIDDFVQSFIDAGLKRFGSGWVWLVVNEDGELEITTTQNQDNPIMFGHSPIIGCDVWEHAYYLKHKSNREAWLETFFEVLDWDRANDVYVQSLHENKK